MKKTLQKEISSFEKGLLTFSEALRAEGQYIEGQYGISDLEMQLIQYVMLNGLQKMKDVSKHFHIKLSTFTSIVDKAENQKILKRVNSKDDRRVVFLDVTAKGKKLYEAYTEHLEDLSRKVEENLSGKEFNQFVQGLGMLNQLALTE